MKKLVIHAGPHKTGSTYIQKKLHENKDCLEKSGISYPNSYYLFYGHHYIINALNGSIPAEEIRDEILKEVGNLDTCILSSENFFDLRESGVVKLKNAFPDVEITFIYYIRRPSIRLLSRWQETIKHGGTSAMSDYFLQHSLRPLASPELNLFNYVEMVRKHLGENSFSLIDYETARAEKNIFQNFKKAANIDIDLHDTDETVNAMMPISEIELIRYLNIRAQQDSLLSGANIREKYTENRALMANEISAFSNQLEKNLKELTLGNVNYDNILHNQLKSKFSDILINSTTPPKPKVYNIPDQNWIFNKHALNIAEKVYCEIKSKI
ncbi:hypothetical protein [Oceanimonas smirnovii]|uniref:hypothetical protein n=1 Tax=Oceanimonas smirnovii TaxID=264574 RepID=UPI00376F4C92